MPKLKYIGPTEYYREHGELVYTHGHADGLEPRVGDFMVFPNNTMEYEVESVIWNIIDYPDERGNLKYNLIINLK